MRTLVVGIGGLIGSSLDDALFWRYGVRSQRQKVNWSNPDLAVRDLSNLVKTFFLTVGEEEWTIAWCAGQGNFTTKADQLDVESIYLSVVLNEIANSCKSMGVFFNASSAGAIYNDPKGSIIDEESPISVNNDYGRFKLKQEMMVSEFATANQVKCINGRIVSVFGPGQNLEKPQGLVSRICLSSLRNEITEIFVPLATTRNYLYVHDATRMISQYISIAHHDRLNRSGYCVTKIFSNFQSYSVASICKAVEQVSRRKVLVRTTTNPKSPKYPPNFLIQSTRDPNLDSSVQTTLIAGVGSVFTDIQKRVNLGIEAQDKKR